MLMTDENLLVSKAVIIYSKQYCKEYSEKQLDNVRIRRLIARRVLAEIKKEFPNLTPTQIASAVKHLI